MQQYQWCLCTISLYGSTSTNNTQAVPVSCSCRRYLHHKMTAVQSAHQSFLIHTGKPWLVTGQLQLHCLSRLDARFIPYVCAFTYMYLLSSIIFTANPSCSSRPCSRVHAVLNHAREHVNILKYTEHFRAYMDLRNQGTTNAG